MPYQPTPDNIVILENVYKTNKNVNVNACLLNNIVLSTIKYQVSGISSPCSMRSSHKFTNVAEMRLICMNLFDYFHYSS